MPAFTWPCDPATRFQAFEKRHASPAAGALFLFAVRAIDSLYYLRDIDRQDDLSQPNIRGHAPDAVEVAHARWATGTCITALDLCAAGLGRALCGHAKSRELDLRQLADVKQAWRSRLPATANAWVDGVVGDTRYARVIEARNHLTHARLTRHFSMPRKRLQLGLESGPVDVPTLIDCALEVSTTKMVEFIAHLPTW
jgi:hypothetical protein